MKQQSDDAALAALMRSAQAGDARAYVRLLKDITPRVRQIIRGQRRFMKAEDVEDVVQDVLLSLHVVRATYDPQRPFMPWLIAVARNRIADAARRYARRAAHEVRVESFPVTSFDEGTNIHSGASRDPEALRQAIAALPAGQRVAVEMLKLREMSLKEAAVASRTSIGALKVSVHRAIAALRKTLSKET